MLQSRPEFAGQASSPHEGGFRRASAVGPCGVHERWRASFTAAAKGWDLKLSPRPATGEKEMLGDGRRPVQAAQERLRQEEVLQRRRYAPRRTDLTILLEGSKASKSTPFAGRCCVDIQGRKHKYIRTNQRRLFTLTLPKSALVVYKEAELHPDNEKYEEMTPKEAAQAFFEACGQRIGTRSESLFAAA